MKKKKIIILTSASLFLFYSCKKNKEDNPVPPSASGVYVAGSMKNTNSITYACYWKNGTKVNLTNPDAGANTDAGALALDFMGNDLYIAGFEKQATGNYRAVYWKNGAISYITDGTYDADARTVTINGNDIYLLFNEKNAAGLSSIKYRKNGALTTVTNGSSNCVASDMAISGSDVYILGYEKTGPYNIYKLWKNGIPAVISASAVPHQSLYFYLTASGSDVYIAGSDRDGGTGTFDKAVLYKNGNRVELTNGINAPAYAWGGIVVSGTDVFCTGSEYNAAGYGIATYWKNSSKTSLGNGTVNSTASDVFIKGSDVYILGQENNSATNKVTALYWKNGAQIRLTDGSLSAYGSAIYVK